MKNNKYGLLAILLLGLGLIIASIIGLLIMVGNDFIKIFKDIYSVSSKHLIMFFVAMTLSILLFVNIFAIAFNFKEMKKEIFKNNQLKINQQIYENKQLQNQNLIECGTHNFINHSSYVYDQNQYENSYNNEIYNENKNDLDYEYEDIIDSNKNNSQIKKINKHNVYGDFSNQNYKKPFLSEIKKTKEVVLKTYLKPGQILPKGYMFDESIGRLVKVENYDEIISLDIQKQLSNNFVKVIN